MAVPLIIDDWYLTLTFLISLGIQATGFAIAYTLQFDKLTDFCGSLNFFLIALITLFSHFSWDPHSFYARNVLASSFLMIWSFRLGSFLLVRVLKTGSDARFDEMRSKILSFAGFWVFQLFWAFTVSLPVTLINSPNVSAPEKGGGNSPFGSATDILGIIFFVFGFLLEVIGDQQKFIWKGKKPGKGAINNNFPWSWTRHPNYTGEIILHWGIWLLVLEPARANAVSNQAKSALYGSVVGPIFITLLLFFVSGLPTAEKPVQKRYYLLENGPDALRDGRPWQSYKEYLNSTSLFWPIPPTLYRPLPKFVKQYILLDLPFFQFNEHKDGPEAIKEAKNKK